MEKSSFWQKYFYYIFLIPFVLFWTFIIFAFYYTQQQEYKNDANNSLRSLESKIDFLKKILSDADAGKIQYLCRTYEELNNSTIVLKSEDGKIIYGSVNNIYPVEISLKTPNTFYTRTKDGLYFMTFKQNFSYAKITLDSPIAELHIKTPFVNYISSYLNIPKILLVSGFGFSFFLLITSFLVSKSVAAPIEEMERCLNAIDGGDLNVKYSVETSFYPDSLAKAVDNVLENFRKKFKELKNSNNNLDAIWTSMTEGVIAIDSKYTVINMNRSAVSLFSIRQNPIGKPLQELIRDNSLHEFAERIFNEEKSIEGELIYKNGIERYLQMRGSVLKDSDGNVIGALVVLADVTQIRKLEKLRHEFVANVSHEIKTPITAIKSAIETLLSGASENPEDAARFMKIITRHADRLNALVQDILSLSSIERDSGKNEASFTEVPMTDIAATASELCHEKAEAKHIKIDIRCESSISVKVDKPLFEQALVNLIDNAIKYSNENSVIEVFTETVADKINIHVRDHGAGIPKEHLPRLFERFYRVDKARSRKLGGTGLGLAIVKHIVQLHQGTVSVESQPGIGSTFTISLPVS